MARGLIGPRETERIWNRHIFNSLALSELIPSGSEIVDVGSGAGLPGLPLALTRTDLQTTLLEPMLRRTTFLDEVIAELDLFDRVRVVRSRAGEHENRYDAVVSRALAPLPKLVMWCDPLMRADGVALALKGASAEAELQQAAGTMKKRKLQGEHLEVRATAESEPTQVIRVMRQR